jgi:hypothetical protein
MLRVLFFAVVVVRHGSLLPLFVFLCRTNQTSQIGITIYRMMNSSKAMTTIHQNHSRARGYISRGRGGCCGVEGAWPGIRDDADARG